VRVLVTGGTGFVGSRLVEALLARGHQINLLVNRTQPVIPEGPSVKYHRCDLTDPVNFRSAGFKSDAAVNVAGQLRVPGLPDEHYWKVHYEATKHVLEECTRFKLKRLVQVSTTGVYGVTGRNPVGEEGPIAPSDIYEKTKWEGERYAREYCSDGKLDLVVARPGLVYGPGDRHLLGLYKAIKWGVFRVIGEGQNFVHPIFIDDLTEGLVACVESPAAAGQAFNLVNPAPVTFRAFCEEIARALGKKLPSASLPKKLARGMGAGFEAIRAVTRMEVPLTRERVDFMTSDRAYDASRARRVLGFSARTSLADGVRATVEAYAGKGWI